MSTILKSYDWSYVSKNNKKARSRLYPWDDWFDGRIWQLEQKVDFDGPATSLERVIRTSANRRGLKVRIRIEPNNIIVVQRHEEEDPGRGVTKSPSLKSIKEARAIEGFEGFVAKAQKVPAKKHVAPPAVTNGDGPVRHIKRRHVSV